MTSPSSAPKRRATHAGSWYTSSPSRLDAELTTWLDKVKASEIPPPDQITSSTNTSTSASTLDLPIRHCRAIIAPHAGYSYSGPAAAWAYRCIPSDPPTTIKRVFILGPSHHHYLDSCALSLCSAYETPLGDLPVDGTVNKEIADTIGAKGDWQWMSKDVDEAEHSIEMHASYIRKIFQGQDITIVPILVGAISTSKESFYGSLLAPYLAHPENFFVVSSDFCHWGSRFSYTFYRASPGAPFTSLTSRTQMGQGEVPIHESIRELDDEGMQAISFPLARAGAAPGQTIQGKSAKEAKEAFATYLRKTKNTVCGRHPIGVLLGALSHLEKEHDASLQTKAECRFVRYEVSGSQPGLFPQM